jgi:hypothetical protein
MAAAAVLGVNSGADASSTACTSGAVLHALIARTHLASFDRSENSVLFNIVTGSIGVCGDDSDMRIIGALD